MSPNFGPVLVGGRDDGEQVSPYSIPAQQRKGGRRGSNLHQGKGMRGVGRKSADEKKLGRLRDGSSFVQNFPRISAAGSYSFFFYYYYYYLLTTTNYYLYIHLGDFLKMGIVEKVT